MHAGGLVALSLGAHADEVRVELAVPVQAGVLVEIADGVDHLAGLAPAAGPRGSRWRRHVPARWRCRRRRARSR